MKNILTIAETDDERDFLIELLEDLHAMTVGIIQQIDYERDVIHGNKKVSKKEFKEYAIKNRNLNTSIYKLFEMMHGIVDYPTYIILRDKIAERVDLENELAEQSDDAVEITLNKTIQNRLESFDHHIKSNTDKTDLVEKRKRGRPRKNS